MPKENNNLQPAAAAPVAPAPAPKSAVAEFKNVLANPEIQNRLGQLFDEKQKSTFVASALEVFSGDSNLQKCNPMEVMREVMKAAALQLPINKNFGFAYVLPYGTKPQFQLGYKAYIQLAIRTGQYRIINADVVYEGEVTNYDKLSGMIELGGRPTSDKVVGYFCYFRLLNGFEKMEYMSVREAAQHAIRYSRGLPRGTSVESLESLAGKVGSGQGWMGNFDDMAIKTCVKRALSKFGYLSIEMQTAFSSENDAEDIRNETVAAEANSKVVNVDAVEYKDVDEQTAPSDGPEDMPY